MNLLVRHVLAMDPLTIFGCPFLVDRHQSWLSMASRGNKLTLKLAKPGIWYATETSARSKIQIRNQRLIGLLMFACLINNILYLKQKNKRRQLLKDSYHIIMFWCKSTKMKRKPYFKKYQQHFSVSNDITYITSPFWNEHCVFILFSLHCCELYLLFSNA